MNRTEPSKESAATTAPHQEALRNERGVRNLVLLTCLGAVDGSILVLAAAGRLADTWTALAVGLTVVSGAGAWIAARQAFHGPKHLRDYALLGGVGALSIAATLLAAWLGVALGTAVSLHVLPRAAGVVMCLIALEVGGVRLPRVAGAPLPVAAVAVAVLLEVAWWIP